MRITVYNTRAELEGTKVEEGAETRARELQSGELGWLPGHVARSTWSPRCGGRRTEIDGATHTPHTHATWRGVVIRTVRPCNISVVVARLSYRRREATE